MAQAAVSDRPTFSCTICSSLLKEPLPCGHNFCKGCVQNYWGREQQNSCPQCRQSLTQRPLLVPNSVLVEVVEQMKRNELQKNLKALSLSSNAPFSLAQGQQQLQAIQEKESALHKLQQDVAHFRHCADEAVRHSEQSLSGLIQWLEFVHKGVTQEIRALQEREEAKLAQLHVQLQQELTMLRMSSELNCLSPGQSLQLCLPPSALNSTYSLPLGSLEQAASAVSTLTDLLKTTLKDGLQSISKKLRPDQNQIPSALSLPEPKTREEFLNYAREIVLDPNTAHSNLSLSRGNRGATHMSSFLSNVHSDHPDRFDYLEQVLSRDGLSGRCYWEMEWRSLGVVIAVSYKSIGRKGNSEDSDFGYNDKSWALNCSKYCFSFWHHSVETKVHKSVSDRMGVYLDHNAGVLTFYNIDKNQNMSLLHRVQATFTQPLHVGVKLKYSGDTANFPKLKY